MGGFVTPDGIAAPFTPIFRDNFAGRVLESFDNLAGLALSPVIPGPTRGLFSNQVLLPRELEDAKFGLLTAAIAPLSGAATAANSASGGVRVLFGQLSVARTFTTAEAGSTFEFAGQSIAEVAAGLRSGAISASQIPVAVVRINGQLVAVNNRSLTALARAGLKPTNVTDLSGDARTVQKVLERLREMGGNQVRQSEFEELGLMPAPSSNKVRITHESIRVLARLY